MGDPPATPIDDEAVHVATTARTYADQATHFVDKYLDFSLFDRHGAAFRDALPETDDRPPRVLDVGCGPGADTAPTADIGLDTVGLDITPAFLREANERVTDARFVCGDMRALPFGRERFEGLWSSAAFLHLPRGTAGSALQEFARVVAPGGALLLSVMASETRGADAVELPDGRQFTFWQEAAIRDRLDAAGFTGITALGEEDDWHALLAIRD